MYVCMHGEKDAEGRILNVNDLTSGEVSFSTFLKKSFLYCLTSHPSATNIYRAPTLCRHCGGKCIHGYRDEWMLESEGNRCVGRRIESTPCQNFLGFPTIIPWGEGLHLSCLNSVLQEHDLSWYHSRDFPGSSVGKESTCNAGDRL